MTSTLKKINKLSPKKLLEGIKLTVENAESLFSAASILKASKKFGIAKSLYILCCEESIKAFALYNKLLINDGRDISTYFQNHKEKLNLIKDGYHYISSETKAMIDSFKIATKKVATNDPKIIEKEAQKHYHRIYKKYLNDTTYINNDKRWWESQNNFKQKGLYVGFTGDNWTTPKTITENEMEITGLKAMYLLGHIIQYKEITINNYKTKNNCG